MVSIEELQRELPGTPFAEGDYTVEPWAQMLLADLLEAPKGGEAELAHPLFAYLATQCGSGTTVADILALGAASAEDGPMMASSDIEILRPLRTGERFGVTGEVVSIERKQGRKAGTFDLMTFRYHLHELHGGPEVATVTNVFVLPRREAADVA